MLRIYGARQHNLKDVNLELPTGKLVVFSGPSGSGKTSLALATLYAEGQRRYIESLAPYARQFLEKIEKPEVDAIEGLAPAIALGQQGGRHNPRSVVATVTEVADYLRIFFAIAGVPHDPETGERLERLSSDEIVALMLGWGDGARVQLLAPLPPAMLADIAEAGRELQRQGFLRGRVNGKPVEWDVIVGEGEGGPSVGTAEVVVDRVVIRPGVESRLSDSLETALRISPGGVIALVCDVGETEWREVALVTKYANAATGYVLEGLEARDFSFNNPQGACPRCEGLGVVELPERRKFEVDPDKTLAAGALDLWTAGGRSAEARMRHLELTRDLRRVAGEWPGGEGDAYWSGEAYGALPEGLRERMFEGGGGFAGILALAGGERGMATSEARKRALARFFTECPCPACRGARLKPESLAVTLAGSDGRELNFAGFLAQDIGEARAFLEGVGLPESGRKVCGEILAHLVKRLDFLVDLGLGYLGLDRPAGTLSGGEAQRLRLACQLGGGLSGVLYVLDEPTIGLHPADTRKMVAALERLRDLGNTLVVVEHDAEVLRAADWIADFGPGAGSEGGRVLASGTLDELMANPESLTGRWLTGEARMPAAPALPEKSLELGSLVLRGASLHNLADIDVEIPLGRLVCLAGPSGSGKSTLAEELLVPALRHKIATRAGGAKSRRKTSGFPEGLRELSGSEAVERVVVIDQSPQSLSPRSNIATLTGLWDMVRDLLAALPVSRQRGYGASRFSFNAAGGRCDHCNGAGSLQLDLQFLPPERVSCSVCHGKRFNRQTLEVCWQGKNPAEILDMTVSGALEFFARLPRISHILKTLDSLGLGYLPLGQPATTFSGGEAQRAKIAGELCQPANLSTLFLLDEPTTGLHYSDISRLLESLYALRAAGHTLVVIEHNPEVLARADWIIELGPGGGRDGGRQVAVGTPDSLARNPESPTGPYLAE